jgi:hypothetical protein
MLGSTSVTFASKTLNKINSPAYASEYLFRDATEEYRLRVRHSLNTSVGADRHNVEVVHTVWATDTDPEIVRKAYVVVELKALDDSVALAAALATFLTASTNAVLGELNDWMV